MKRMHQCQVSVFLLLFLYISTSSSAQNAVGIKNLEILNIAQSIDWKKMNVVEIHGNMLRALEGFKWVQINNRDTYILLPDEYQESVVDFRLLLPGPGRNFKTLNPKGFSYRIFCSGNSLADNGICSIKRRSRTELQCECPAGQWKIAPYTSRDAIIIPAF